MDEPKRLDTEDVREQRSLSPRKSAEREQDRNARTQRKRSKRRDTARTVQRVIQTNRGGSFVNKGTRVRLSSLAIRDKVFTKPLSRIGTVVGLSSKYDECLVVLWDGQKSKETIHWSFLVEVENVVEVGRS